MPTLADPPKPASLDHSRAPVIVRLARELPEGQATWEAPERYDPATQLVEEGRWFCGSPKSNTRCSRFTLLGADKTYNDDTRERKR